MTFRLMICLFAVTLFEDHGIKVDRAEFLSLSIFFSSPDEKHVVTHTHTQMYNIIAVMFISF